MKPTSIAAFVGHQDSGRAATQEQRVLAYITRHGPCTRQQISKGTGIAINAVCGRVGHLLAIEEIDASDKMYCPCTGNLVEALVVRSGQLRLV